MSILPVNGINSYSNQKTETSFKGFRSQMVFKTTFENMPGLTQAVSEAVATNNIAKVSALFDEAFTQISLALGKPLKVFKSKNSPDFGLISYKDRLGRRVIISKSIDRNGQPYLNYEQTSHWFSLSRLFPRRRSETINYYYTPKGVGKIMLHDRFKFDDFLDAKRCTSDHFVMNDDGKFVK